VAMLRSRRGWRCSCPHCRSPRWLFPFRVFAPVASATNTRNGNY